jgi:hypothetical protein
VINPRETVPQTALRLVREWAELRIAMADSVDHAEIEADRDVVTAWLLGQDAKQKGGKIRR